MSNKSNKLVNYLVAWILITIIGIILFLLPAVCNVQPANTGITLYVIGVLMAGLGFGMTINYSIGILKQKISEPQTLPIVEWIFTKEEWKQYCVHNLKFNIKSFFKIFYLIIIIGIIIDILLFFSDELKGAYDLLLSETITMFSIIVVYPLFIYLINILSRREVKIFDSAVMISGVLYNWEMPQGKLIDIELISENLPLINFVYSSPLRRINTFFSSKQKRSFLSVPVPYYDLNKAVEIVDKFQKDICQ